LFLEYAFALSRNLGLSSPMSRPPSIPCGNMPFGFESRSFSSIQNPGSLNWKPLAFVRQPPLNGSIWSPLSPSSMAPPRAWPFSSLASALRLTPIGRGASATSKLVCAGSREPLTKGVRCSNPSPFSPLTLNLALPLKELKPGTMTASGFLESSPCTVSYHPGRLHKDVSGSQGVPSALRYFHLRVGVVGVMTALGDFKGSLHGGIEGRGPLVVGDSSHSGLPRYLV
jgi:hypothetical protein